jgi:uncharacterized membrane protein YcaP (DUF421 family)
MLRHNMRRELMTVDELQSQLRAQGVKDLSEVRSAFLEPDGELSIIRAGASGGNPGSHKRRSGAH